MCSVSYYLNGWLAGVCARMPKCFAWRMDEIPMHTARCLCQTCKATAREMLALATTKLKRPTMKRGAHPAAVKGFLHDRIWKSLKIFSSAYLWLLLSLFFSHSLSLTHSPLLIQLRCLKFMISFILNFWMDSFFFLSLSWLLLIVLTSQQYLKRKTFYCHQSQLFRRWTMKNAIFKAVCAM